MLFWKGFSEAAPHREWYFHSIFCTLQCAFPLGKYRLMIAICSHRHWVGAFFRLRLWSFPQVGGHGSQSLHSRSYCFGCRFQFARLLTETDRRAFLPKSHRKPWQSNLFFLRRVRRGRNWCRRLLSLNRQTRK